MSGVDIDACPWLLELLGLLADRSVPGNEVERGPFEGRDARADVDALEAQLEEVMRGIQERRLELADDGDDVVDDHFRWVLRWDTWTANRTGLSYDCFMASARPGA